MQLRPRGNGAAGLTGVDRPQILSNHPPVIPIVPALEVHPVLIAAALL